MNNFLNQNGAGGGMPGQGVNVHGKKTFLIVITLIVIVFLVVFALRQFNAPRSNSSIPETAPAVKSAMLEETKARVFELASRPSLTTFEKKEIIDAIGGTKVRQYNFTKTELEKIMGALNK